MGIRKQRITEMERKLHETWSSEEDSLFYYHRSEERVVLSHALFWGDDAASDIETLPMILNGSRLRG